jgi:hypothetical protein
MKNMKKVISRVMIIALTTYSLVSGISASAVTKGAIKPQLMVTGLRATYKYNSQIKMNVLTTNYTRKVKYKVSLYSFDSKKTLDLTKGYSKSIGGNKAFILSTMPKGSGKYTIKIYVKALASKASYDNYLEKTFVIEANKTMIVAQFNYAQGLAAGTTVGTAIGDVKNDDLVEYQKVIEASKAIKNNFYSSQAEVNNGLKALVLATTAFKNSVIKPADKTALVKVISTAQQILNDTRVGTPPLQTGQVLAIDRAALVKAIITATSVAADGNAGVEEVNAAIVKLNAGITLFNSKLYK